jgi:hypothetical protein
MRLCNLWDIHELAKKSHLERGHAVAAPAFAAGGAS